MSDLEGSDTFIPARDIGMVSPYTAQKRYLSDLLAAACYRGIQIDTVEKFQGDGCDIIIWTTVRSNRNNALGFMSDPQRLNVAIARARKLLVVVGNV